MYFLLLLVGSCLSCTSKFFCPGPVLDTIQTNPHMQDGKYFVDMAMARPEKDIMKDFNKMYGTLDKEDIKRFLDKNFHVPGYELDKVTIENYPPTPAFLDDIKDEKIRGFGEFIHEFWKTLVRKYNGTRLCNGCESSLIAMEYPFVIPGGRFREFYYWDSFFVLEGLNLSNLQEMSKNMLMNFLDFVHKIGHIPNAARKYMLNRSQPPFLSIAFDKYIQKTKDYNFLANSIHLLDKEYQYWQTKHSVRINHNGEEYLTRYVVNCTSPRPESYREDRMTAHFAPGISEDAERALYAELAAGAESGWDYSSRWIPDATARLESGPVTQEDMLRGLRISSILPVDLNSLMYLNERTLAKFHTLLASKIIKSKSMSDQKINHLLKAKEYNNAANTRAALMHKYMWDPNHHSFFDYDLNSSRRITRFSPSNIWPFWADAFTPEFRKNTTNHLLAFQTLEQERTQRIGATPTTHLNSTLQWDYPNSWAPLEYISIEAILNSHDLLPASSPHRESLKNMAIDIANRFFQSAFCAWHSTGGSTKTLARISSLPPSHKGFLFEKYNTDKIGKVGGGGEYHVQVGFGWTNGVLLHLLNRFPDALILPTNLSDCLTNITIPHENLLYGRTTPYKE
ncbi:hypothetical protein DSO57_1014488 [Entomophthora muscae]|uniref:Uncharacterized protein n=1 Tax=Entomophthora muscae TaxID=34485 RepID=A0ACC2TSE6_9FUNG|nr:hypothetical protein DSO57_1014488 [Entomophthora muscae]